MFNEGFAERTCSRFTRQFSRCLEDRRAHVFTPWDRMPRITRTVVCCSRENSRFSAYFVVFPQSRRCYLRLDLVAKRYWLKIHRECFNISNRGHKISSHLRVYVCVCVCSYCQIQILEYRISPFQSFRFEQPQYSGNFRADKI